jgi:methionyl-tRNA synthetase
VPVPGDPSQVCYVWFDALANYLTGLGYGTEDSRFERFWRGGGPKLHVIGKNVVKFHAIYWPAWLLSAGLPLPETIWAHGFLTVDGRKISKSLGNAVDPSPLVSRYGADAIRYYLLRAIPSGSDGDFSESRLRQVYRSDLANGLGNLVRRVEALRERAGEIRSSQGGNVEEPSGVSAALEAFRFGDALKAIWDRVGELNREIDRARPWDLLKGTPGTDLKLLLSRWTADLRSVARGLAPFLPGTAARIEERFSGRDRRIGEPLFPRLVA